MTGVINNIYPSMSIKVAFSSVANQPVLETAKVV